MARLTVPKQPSVKKPSSAAETEIARRAQAIVRTEIAFIHNSEFNRKDAPRVITNDPALAAGVSSEPTSPSRPGELSVYFASLFAVPLLTAGREAALFRLMNYLKFRANRLRSSLKPQTAKPEMVAEIEALLSQAAAARESIIVANLRLVVAMARKYSHNRQTFDDLVSEGNLALLRAVEKFDYSKGYRFSTYATHAIQHDLYRLIKRQQTEQSHSERPLDERIDQFLEESEDDTWVVEQSRRFELVSATMNCELDERDRRVLSLRFGIDCPDGPLTLREIGGELGLSKERVRQLEVRAIDKLKLCVAGQP